jgi:hypothetical protein
MALQNFVSRSLPAISAAWLNLIDNFVIGTGSGPPNGVTSAETAAGVTPLNYAYPPGHVFRYMTAVQIASVQAEDFLQDVTTAIQAAINQHIAGGPEVLIACGGYLISSSLNMGDDTVIYNGLRILSEGLPTIRSNNLTQPILTIGGERMEIGDFVFQYSSLPTNVQTNAVAIRCYNLYESRLGRIYCTSVFGAVDQYQGTVMGSQNSFYSNSCKDIRVTQFSGWAIRLQPFSGGNTGNVWSNIYISNATDGTPSNNTPCFGALWIQTSNDGVIEQMNIEWCRNSSSLIVLNQAGNIKINSLHFEGNYPATPLQPLIDIPGGDGSAPVFSAVTVSGNDWTGLGGANQGALFRIDNGGTRLLVSGLLCYNNTNPTFMNAVHSGGSSSYGSTVEVQTVNDLDGSLSTDAYTPKVSFGTPAAGVEYPLYRWNRWQAKHVAACVDNAGGTNTAVDVMQGNPASALFDPMTLWNAADERFDIKQSGAYVCSVVIPTSAGGCTIVISLSGANVGGIVIPPGGGSGLFTYQAARGQFLQFVNASGSYTRTGVQFSVSLG